MELLASLESNCKPGLASTYPVGLSELGLPMQAIQVALQSLALPPPCSNNSLPMSDGRREDGGCGGDVMKMLVGKRKGGSRIHSDSCS